MARRRGSLTIAVLALLTSLLVARAAHAQDSHYWFDPAGRVEAS